MGNCQAAEAATVMIQHPSGRVERIYWSLSANQVMASNPGHYVAVIITPTTQKLTYSTLSTITTTSHGSSSKNGAEMKHYLKLLRPADTLHIGHVYRLVTFEEVLKDFASKKYARLKTPKTRSKKYTRDDHEGEDSSSAEVREEQTEMTEDSNKSRSSAATRNWKPALQSIEETATSIWS